MEMAYIYYYLYGIMGVIKHISLERPIPYTQVKLDILRISYRLSVISFIFIFNYTTISYNN